LATEGIASVTLLATAHLHGDLARLPRLFTLIQRERAAAGGVSFLLDLGDSCALDVWLCRATQGRAPLMVLDAMGYDAALVGGPEAVPIPVPSLLRLRELITMPVIPWGRAASLTRKGITLGLATGEAVLPGDRPGFRVDRSSDALPESGAATVMLGDVPPGHLARVDVAWPDWTVTAARLVALAPDTPPDPTILATVEFVQDEARDYARRQGGVSGESG
jgi:hypothetical protein